MAVVMRSSRVQDAFGRQSEQDQRLGGGLYEVCGGIKERNSDGTSERLSALRFLKTYLGVGIVLDSLIL